MSEASGFFHRVLGAQLILVAAISLTACSGVEIVPAATDTFEARQYTRYAWRSEPPAPSAFSKDMSVQKSPSIREGVTEQLSDLGYRRVDRSDAEFLVEYFAAPGFNDGQLPYGGSNDMLYGSSVNREIDGASASNARALSGPVETGDIQVIFFDAKTSEVLWRVQISIVVEDSNRIDHDEVRDAVRKALADLPPVG
jgi:hypothetical protein